MVYQLLLHTPLSGRFDRIALFLPVRITPHHLPPQYYVLLHLLHHPPLLRQEMSVRPHLYDFTLTSKALPSLRMTSIVCSASRCNLFSDYHVACALSHLYHLHVEIFFQREDTSL